MCRLMYPISDWPAISDEDRKEERKEASDKVQVLSLPGLLDHCLNPALRLLNTMVEVQGLMAMKKTHTHNVIDRKSNRGGL